MAALQSTTLLAGRKAVLSTEQTRFLRRVARQTWSYFDAFVGPPDNWLPPDNFQEYRVAAIAHRTSPTNMGLALLADKLPAARAAATSAACAWRAKLRVRKSSTLSARASPARASAWRTALAASSGSGCGPLARLLATFTGSCP